MVALKGHNEAALKLSLSAIKAVDTRDVLNSERKNRSTPEGNQIKRDKEARYDQGA